MDNKILGDMELLSPKRNLLYSYLRYRTHRQRCNSFRKRRGLPHGYVLDLLYFRGQAQRRSRGVHRSQTSSPILRRERTRTPIDDEPEAKSGSLFILREWRAVEETKNLGLLREELRKGNSRVQIKKGKTLGSTRAKRV